MKFNILISLLLFLSCSRPEGSKNSFPSKEVVISRFELGKWNDLTEKIIIDSSSCKYIVVIQDKIAIEKDICNDSVTVAIGSLSIKDISFLKKCASGCRSFTYFSYNIEIRENGKNKIDYFDEISDCENDSCQL